MNELYGKEFILKIRASGYKSAIYAMAEIIDNSVDAGAKNIEIVLIERFATNGQRRTRYVNEVHFVDDGCGMSEFKLNGCLTFSTGDGKTDTRIGAFGVGLPNSSMFVGSRVEVFSRSVDDWKYVYLDVEEQLERDRPGYDIAVSKNPELLRTSVVNPKTVVKWKKIDNIGASRASTLIDRCKVLLGRLYRYKLKSEVSISFRTFVEGDTSTSDADYVLPFDPLFLTESENYITKPLWDAATVKNLNVPHPELGSKREEFNSSFHYKKHIEGCEANQIRPIFQRYDPYWDTSDSIELNGRTYTWRIKSAFACKSITNPGIRNGGGTHVGQELRVKMNGNQQLRGGNIYFIRADREIDCGHFGLYNVTNVKDRFWTIEIHFDSNLDSLMGIANTKQSVAFRAVSNDALDEIGVYQNLNLTQQREYLWQKMTKQILSSIKEMKKELSAYTREFIASELAAQNEGVEVDPIPEAGVEVFPTGNSWSEQEIVEITKLLKKKLMHLHEEDIERQVRKHAKNQTRTIVLYAANEANNLFEIKPKEGRLITFINTRHKFYTNVLQPLKETKFLKPFATPIEMLISSMALKMDELIAGDSEYYEEILSEYNNLVALSLSTFLSKGKIELKLDEIEERFNKAFKDS